MNESARQRHALLFSAGELQRVVIESLGEAHLREDVSGVLLSAGLAAEFQRIVDAYVDTKYKTKN